MDAAVRLSQDRDGRRRGGGSEFDRRLPDHGGRALQRQTGHHRRSGKRLRSNKASVISRSGRSRPNLGACSDYRVKGMVFGAAEHRRSGRGASTKAVTIRYYERIGLLPAPDRSTGNYRTYGKDALERLRFIGVAVRSASPGPGAGPPCAGVRSGPSVRGGRQDDRRAPRGGGAQDCGPHISRLAAELRNISASCPGGGTISSCRIIEAISPAT